MKKTAAKGHTRKHTGTRKHAATSKHHPVHHHKAATAHGHHVHTVAKHPSHAKARGLAIADGVACCSAQALAASLLLAGGRADDDDVLELYEATACCHDSGAAILATLEAAAEFGLAGYRPVSYGMAWRDLNPQSPAHSAPARARIPAWAPAPDSSTAPGPCGQGSSLILGLELPGPHTVLAAGGRWWSWGRPWSPSEFPAAVIEEAWAVTWA